MAQPKNCTVGLKPRNIRSMPRASLQDYWNIHEHDCKPNLWEINGSKNDSRLNLAAQ